ncbi:MAG: alanine racemase [Albidovulum sp.]|nr:alanine racemase [Albidovulum sp.]
MVASNLTIDLAAIRSNWRGIDSYSPANCETAAVVKANAYGLGMEKTLRTLKCAGAKSFFVALAEEGSEARKFLPGNEEIFVLSGHMEGDSGLLSRNRLTPVLNSAAQAIRHLEQLPGHPFGVQLDTGMNRLGMGMNEFADVRERVLIAKPVLAMSHLACADEPEHPMNSRQLSEFKAATFDLGLRRSLAATGGVLLGPEYHFDLCRPGIGLFGGLPYAAAEPVVHLELPVIQVRELRSGESVGYGAAWTADAPAKIATASGGYADGILRAMGRRGRVFAKDIACKIVGRVSMDLLTIDVSDLEEVPSTLQLLGDHQGVDEIAEAAGTIGYEILTGIGIRCNRIYRGEIGN